MAQSQIFIAEVREERRASGVLALFFFGLVVGFWGAFVQSVIFNINYEKLGSINCGGGGNANRQEKITRVSAAET